VSGMQERAARALAAMSYAEHFPDDPPLWEDYPDATDKMRAAGERLRKSYSDRSRPYAAAILAVAADVDGLAGVLSKHFVYAEWAGDANRYIDVCTCNWRGSTVGTGARHQSEAVAAHILGRQA